MSNLGAADGGDGPGGVALIDHDTFEVTGAWETDRGEQHVASPMGWAPGWPASTRMANKAE
jgi:methanethiol oxidase